MLESTFLEDWDEIGAKMAKKGHLLPKSGINSEIVSIQRVKAKKKQGKETLSRRGEHKGKNLTEQNEYLECYIFSM